MSYNWKILRAAVEQEILFPNRKAYEKYIVGLQRNGMPYEVVSEAEQYDGTMVVIMRKRYNPQNAFLRKGDWTI